MLASQVAFSDIFGTLLFMQANITATDHYLLTAATSEFYNIGKYAYT